MIAFAGAELPPSAAKRISERGVAGVTLFRVHNIVDPPQIRGLTARHPGRHGRPEHHRCWSPPTRRAASWSAWATGRRSSRARWRSARRATKRWPSASPAPRRASCGPSASTWTTRPCATWPTTRPIRRSASAASATIPKRWAGLRRRPSAACRARASPPRPSTSRAPATRRRIRTTSCRWCAGRAPSWPSGSWSRFERHWKPARGWS